MASMTTALSKSICTQVVMDGVCTARERYARYAVAGVAAILIPVKYEASSADAPSANAHMGGLVAAVKANPVLQALPIRKVRRVTLINAAPWFLLPAG
jgi:hypothetical protein